MHIPEEIKDKLLAWFGFPDEDVFCQVATCAKLESHIRTMRVNKVNEQGSFIFFTATTTKKWYNLERNPVVAICLFKDLKQILIEGTVRLHTYQSTPLMVQDYWEELALVWQQFYYSKMINSRNKDPVPDTFGIIEVIPTLYETLAIDSMHYLQSERIQLRKVLNTWVRREMTPG
jgi:general stress protein 26